MKKHLLILCAVLAALLLAACTKGPGAVTPPPTAPEATDAVTDGPTAIVSETPTADIPATEAPSPAPTPTPGTDGDPTAAVVFNDPVFEAAFRSKYGFTGEIVLGDLQAFTELDLEGAGLTDISDAAKFTNLESLSLGYNEITGGVNHISDLSPLAGLSKLTRLYLARNEVRDLSPLAGLSNLRILWLMENAVTDIRPLAGLTKLEYLDLSRNVISDLGPLENLFALETLKVQDNEVWDVSPLAGLFNLSTLQLDGNGIRDIDPLSSLSALSYLNVSFNNISSVDCERIRGMTSLTMLYLSGNPIPQSALFGLSLALPNCTIFS